MSGSPAWDRQSNGSEDEALYLKLRGRAKKRCDIDMLERTFQTEAEKQSYYEKRLAEHMKDVWEQHRER